MVGTSSVSLLNPTHLNPFSRWGTSTSPSPACHNLIYSSVTVQAAVHGDSPAAWPHSTMLIVVCRAADAATTFPESEVLATDIAEIPRLVAPRLTCTLSNSCFPSALPSNVTFLAADLTKPFDFKPDQFDIVHGRLLFLSVRDAGPLLSPLFSLKISLFKSMLLAAELQGCARAYDPSCQARRLAHNRRTASYVVGK